MIIALVFLRNKLALRHHRRGSHRRIRLSLCTNQVFGTRAKRGSKVVTAPPRVICCPNNTKPCSQLPPITIRNCTKVHEGNCGPPTVKAPWPTLAAAHNCPESSCQLDRSRWSHRLTGHWPQKLTSLWALKPRYARKKGRLATLAANGSDSQLHRRARTRSRWRDATRTGKRLPSQELRMATRGRSR